jgi:hypothetical protein
MRPALRRYLAAVMDVYAAACAHDRAGARYLAARGLGTPDSVPETSETIPLLQAWGHRRVELDKAHRTAEALHDALSAADLLELHALHDEPAPDSGPRLTAPGGAS